MLASAGVSETGTVTTEKEIKTIYWAYDIQEAFVFIFSIIYYYESTID